MIKKFTTGKGDFLAVIVPEDATDFKVINGQATLDYYHAGEMYGLELPEENEHTIIGLLKDLTEEQWEEIVKDPTWVGGFGNIYDNYLNDKRPIHLRENGFKTATESGKSLMEREKIYTVNPYGEKPEYRDYVPAYLNDNFNKKNKEYDFEYDLSQWQEAEKHVGNYLILKAEKK